MVRIKQEDTKKKEQHFLGELQAAQKTMIKHSDDALEERPDDIDLCILLKKNYQVEKSYYNFEPEVREGGKVE